MSLRWRWSLVVVLAAMVLGGFLPQTILGGSHAPATLTVATYVGPPTFPSGCSGSSCGRTAPTPAAPVLTIAGLAAATATVVRAKGGYWSRRIRPRMRSLPRGTVMSLFRPPQLSAFSLAAL
jgi:hypothetical protein